MNTSARDWLARTLLLTSCLITSLADACVLTPLRHQHVWLPSLTSAASLSLPVERTVQRGDLFSVYGTPGMRIQQVGIDGQAVTIASPLSDEDYLTLTRRGGGQVPMEIKDPILSKHGQWQHFVADKPGLAYLKLSRNRESSLIRITVEPEKIVPRSRTRRVDESAPQSTIYLGPEDLLELVLPGSLSEPWSLVMDEGAVRLLALLVGENIATDRVVLRLQPALATREGRLTVSQGGRRFQFILGLMPVPTC